MLRNIMCLILLLSLCSCTGIEIEGDKIKKENINIFKNTEAWSLAIAVKNQDIKKIKKIAAKNPSLLNLQEPNYDVTLLIWAVGMEKYKSAEALLKCGAEPNIVADGTEKYNKYIENLLEEGGFPDGTFDVLLGETALYIASEFSWIDNQAKKDPKYVKLLLKYGADPNICYIGTSPIVFPPKSQNHNPNGIGYHYGGEPGTSPLMNSIRCGIEKTKALVEGGADINHKTIETETAAVIALRAGQNATLEGMEYARYLIVEKRANITDHYYISRHTMMQNDNPNDKFYPIDLLNDWDYPIGSAEYNIKMNIIEEFERQGVALPLTN